MRNPLIKQSLQGFFRSHHFLVPLLGLLLGYCVYGFVAFTTLGKTYTWLFTFGGFLMGVVLAIAWLKYCLNRTNSWIIPNKLDENSGGLWSIRFGKQLRTATVFFINLQLGSWILPPQLPILQLYKESFNSQWVRVDCVDSVAQEARVDGGSWVRISRSKSKGLPWVGPMEIIEIPRTSLLEFEQSGVPYDVNWPQIFGSRGYACRLQWPNQATSPKGIRHVGVADWLSWNGLLECRLRCLKWMWSRLDQQLLPSSSSMAKAMLVGETRGVDDQTVAAFGVGGLMHVLAVSGMHVSLVMGALLWLFTGFGRIGKPKAWVLVFLLAVGWFYAVLTGGSAAVVRAVLSATWMWIAKYGLGKRVSALHVWLGCAYVQLLFQPYIIYNLGFVLSYLAVLSLIVFYPMVLDRWILWSRNDVFGEKRVLTRGNSAHRVGKFRELGIAFWEQLLGIVAMNISATLYTFPWIMSSFGSFPVWFLPVNLVMVPLFTVLLYAGLGVLMLGWIPGVGDGVGFMVDALYEWVIKLLLLVLKLPFAQLHSVEWDGVSIVLTCIGIALLSVLLWLQVRFGESVQRGWLLLGLLVFGLGFSMEYQRTQYLNQPNYFAAKIGNRGCWGYKRGEILVVTVYAKQTYWEGNEKGRLGEKRWVAGWNSDSIYYYRKRWENQLKSKLEKYRLREGITTIRVRW